MKNNISKKILREFGFLIGIIFPILIGWILPAIGGHAFRVWTLCVGIPSIIIAILCPFILYYPYKAWMKLGLILGWLNSRIILGLVFLIILQPIAFIMKLFSYDPLRSKNTSAKSYREIKSPQKINLKKIF